MRKVSPAVLSAVLTLAAVKQTAHAFVSPQPVLKHTVSPSSATGGGLSRRPAREGVNPGSRSGEPSLCARRGERRQGLSLSRLGMAGEGGGGFGEGSKGRKKKGGKKGRGSKAQPQGPTGLDYINSPESNDYMNRNIAGADAAVEALDRNRGETLSRGALDATETGDKLDIDALLTKIGIDNKDMGSKTDGVQPKPGEEVMITVFDVIPDSVQNVFEKILIVGFSLAMLFFVAVGCGIGIEAYAKASGNPLPDSLDHLIADVLEPKFTPSLFVVFGFSITLGIFKLGQAGGAKAQYRED